MADSHTCPANPAHTASVRLALPTEATAIAEIQQRAWTDDPDLAVLTNEVNGTDAATAWSEAIMRPPMADFRVLVALEPDEDGAAVVRGFAAIGPSEDADAEHTDALVAEFAVDPRHRGQGHGSRLLNAVVDTLRADRFTRATWWVPADSSPKLAGVPTARTARPAPRMIGYASRKSGCTPGSVRTENRHRRNAPLPARTCSLQTSHGAEIPDRGASGPRRHTVVSVFPM